MWRLQAVGALRLTQILLDQWMSGTLITLIPPVQAITVRQRSWLRAIRHRSMGTVVTKIIRRPKTWPCKIKVQAAEKGNFLGPARQLT